MAYSGHVKKTHAEKLERQLSALPLCCREYLDLLSGEKAPATILAYARDLNVYFEFLTQKLPRFRHRKAAELKPDEVGAVTFAEAAAFVQFLSSYRNRNGIRRTNHPAGEKRKISTVRNFYRHYCLEELFDHNPMDVIETPKVKEPKHARLNAQEIFLLLDNAEFGNHLSGRQKKFHSREKNRDLALLYLMLSTGIRVSECVELDLDDLDIESCCLLLRQNGLVHARIYYSDECGAYLMSYLQERLQTPTAEPDEKAFFLSRYGSRLSARSVQKLVKKYTAPITEKNMHPHVLRKSCGRSRFEKIPDGDEAAKS
jgi:site-specific recombinase XerD